MDKKEEVQEGPCIICGRKNYPLSMGGSKICPSCDCGCMIVIGNKKYVDVRYIKHYFPETEAD